MRWYDFCTQLETWQLAMTYEFTFIASEWLANLQLGPTNTTRRGKSLETRLAGARATLDCAGAKIFFCFPNIFDDYSVLCPVKSDKQKFKDKAFINRWSASQIKHITAKSNSRLRQKILFDIDYQSFAVGESLFVSRCRRSRWRFVCNEYLASTLSVHFWAVQGSASDCS